MTQTPAQPTAPSGSEEQAAIAEPQPWPLAPSDDSAECSSVLRGIIRSTLGHDGILRVDGGRGIYLREPGQPGLSQVGKDTLLRILDKVRVLEGVSSKYYKRVSEDGILHCGALNPARKQSI